MSRCCSRRRYGARLPLNLPPLDPPRTQSGSRISSGVGFSVRLGVNWYIPNSRRRHFIPFPILSGVLVSLATRFIDSAATTWSLTTKFLRFGSVYFFGSPLRPANGRSAPPTLRTPLRDQLNFDMLIKGEKYACEACVRGHRVSNCQHSDRPLQHINKKVCDAHSFNGMAVS